MKNITPELIAAAKATKSAEELLELAKANNVEITEEEAKTYFDQLHTNAELSDDELEAVAGGGIICEIFENILRPTNEIDKSNRPYCVDELDNSMPDISITHLPSDSKNKNKTEYL